MATRNSRKRLTAIRIRAARPTDAEKRRRRNRATISSLLTAAPRVSAARLAAARPVDPDLPVPRDVPDIDVGPIEPPPRPLPRPILRDPPPLLLLPLRLEYRIVQARALPQVVDLSDTIAALADADRRMTGTSLTARRERAVSSLAVRSSAMTMQLKSTPARLAGQTEIWFRWYPDDGFVTKGIAPPTEAEAKLLAAFRARVGTRPAFDLSDPQTAAAWTEFAGEVGAYRALHLLREPVQSGQTLNAAAMGAIMALPKTVSLFTLTGETLLLLATGAAIPQNTATQRSVVAYTPEAAEPGGWLRDFPVAEQHGMALKLNDAAAVTRALAADFIIAVGRFERDGASEIGTLLRDGIANGNFELLRQDTPTNNSPAARSPAADPTRDLTAFVQEAAMNERGAIPSNGDAAADLLADALGIDRTLVRKAVRAGDTPFADARAMLRVIGPALLDGSLDGVTAVQGVDENTFIEILAAAFCARGQLPPARFGQNPYGVLPMTGIAELITTNPEPKTSEVHAFLARYAKIVRELLPPFATQAVPVLQPNDTSAAAKLEELLKTNRVSTRLVVADEKDPNTAPLGCPYVLGSRPADQPATYLRDLSTKALSALSDPTASDTLTPLLYRLARLSLTINIVNFVISDIVFARPVARNLQLTARPSEILARDPAVSDTINTTGLFQHSVRDLATISTIPGISAAGIQLITQVQKGFLDALSHLEKIAARPQGIAQLEMLLFETIDLFQHRSDAWVTGLAYARLTRQRKSGLAGLNAGYYGFIGKLREAAVTGRTNGYLQAPSMAQATTAAVLRSAFMRQAGGGAFALDLGSRRLRQALSFLDVLKKGIAIEEALGLRGERWLHDNKLSRLTPDLRRHFPVLNAAGPEATDTSAAAGDAGIRVFDGMRFISGNVSMFPAADQPRLQELKAVLAEELDALSDLVVAEAAHQRAMGQAEASKAWLNVLSGGGIPGTPQFVRTQRSAQGSTYRLSFVLPQAAAPAGATPREIAEPGLATLAATYLSGFAAVGARVTIERTNDATKRHSVDVTLHANLSMRALDLVVGGRSEFEVRMRHHIVALWLRDAAFRNALGPIVPEGLNAFVNGQARISVDDIPQAASLGQMLTKANTLRSLIQNARMLEPADFNAAASPSALLDEATEVGLVNAGTLVLRERATALKASADAARTALANGRAGFMQTVRPIRLAMDAGTTPPATVAQLAAAEAARRTLETARVSIAAYAEPGALRAFTIEEAIADPDSLEEALIGIEARVSAKSARLAQALAASATAATRLEAARASRRTVLEALQSTLDGDALPILVPFGKVPATVPLIDAAQNVDALVAPWRGVRRTVALSGDIANALAGFKAFPVSPAATGATPSTDPNRDPRDETEAPLSRHFGILLAHPSTLAGKAFTGFVTDEWAEQRPSRTQPAGLAVNYDSPQAEAPQCLLLCVAPRGNVEGKWADDAAARMVAETIAWTKVRAINTDQKPWPAAFLPNSNQVPSKDGSARIPKKTFKGLPFDVTVVHGTFNTMSSIAADQSWGASKVDLNERVGFFGIKE